MYNIILARLLHRLIVRKLQTRPDFVQSTFLSYTCVQYLFRKMYMKLKKKKNV